jgi:hypothetical protein
MTSITLFSPSSILDRISLRRRVKTTGLAAQPEICPYEKVDAQDWQVYFDTNRVISQVCS